MVLNIQINSLFYALTLLISRGRKEKILINNKTSYIFLYIIVFLERKHGHISFSLQSYYRLNTFKNYAYHTDFII